MKDLKYWTARKKYTLKEAVLLIIRENPASDLTDAECSKHRRIKNRYIPVKKTIIEAIESSGLRAEVKYLEETDSTTESGESRLNMELSKVDRIDLAIWIHGSKLDSEFFSSMVKALPVGKLGRKGSRNNPMLDSSTVNIESYQALEAEFDDIKNRYQKLAKKLKAVLREKRTIESDYYSLMDEIANAGELKPLERKCYLNMIAVLLKFISGDFPNVAKHPFYVSKTTLMNDIDYHFCRLGRKCKGLAMSNLSHKFPKARRSLEFDLSRRPRK